MSKIWESSAITPFNKSSDIAYHRQDRNSLKCVDIDTIDLHGPAYKFRGGCPMQCVILCSLIKKRSLLYVLL